MSIRNVIVIGSGPAGLTAGLYAARANLNPLLIEGLEAGGQLMMTTLVENWPGYRDGIMGPDLMAEMRAQSEKFGAEISEHATAVNLHHRPFTVKASEAEYRTPLCYCHPSAPSAWPAVRRTLMRATCATCTRSFRGREIAVVGGGDSAMEEALF
jgi:thioredoxin reductase (NADPH)